MVDKTLAAQQKTEDYSENEIFVSNQVWWTKSQAELK